MYFQKIRNLNLTRYDLILMFGIYQTAMFMRSANFSFPLYSNITPEWLCVESHMGDNLSLNAGEEIYENIISQPLIASESWSKNCTIHSWCPKDDLRFQAPFRGAREEFGLICDRAYQAALVSSIQFVGVLVGTNAFAYFSDVFGRQKILAFVTLFEIITGFCSSFATGPIMLAVLRFFTGFFGGGGLVVTTVFMLESIRPEQRIFMRTFVSYPTIKFITILICYLCRDWRNYMRITNLLGLPLPVFLLFLIPESVKWALDRGKTELATSSQNRINRINGKKITKDPMELSLPLAQDIPTDSGRKMSEGKKPIVNPDKPGDKKPRFRELLASKQMRIETCVLCMMWLTTATTGYTIGFDSRNLAGDFYVNQLLLGVLGLVNNVSLFLLDTFIPRFNRRVLHQIPQFAVIVFSTIASICLAVGVTGRLEFLVTACALTASFFNGFLWDAIYLSTGEIFPTQFRATAYGICNIFGRSGVIFTPQIVLLREKWAPGPYLIIAILGTISFGLSYKYLPDTKGKELPGNVKEADKVVNNGD